MKLITISRQFGSGGRELGKRLADLLEFDYYDSEIIAAVAKNSGLSPNYVENMLGDGGFRNYPITCRRTLGSGVYLQNNQVQLLLEQKKVIEAIADQGRDCIIVGRNADLLLQEYAPLRLFICADEQARVARCKERAPVGEQLSDKELLRQIRRIDKQRAATREILSGAPWGDPAGCDLMVNTTGREIKTVTAAVAAYARVWFGERV